MWLLEILVPLYNAEYGGAVKHEREKSERNRPIKVTIKMSFRLQEMTK